MSDFFDHGPFWLVFALLFAGAMARGQMMYWIGRVVTEQALRRTRPTEGWRRRVHSWLAGGGADPGIRAIRRWGLAIVPVGYLTVGFQSMVQVGAGVLRIRLLWYALAQIPGALAWALIYSTIGFAIWGAILAAAAGSPLGLTALALAAIVLITTIVLRRRHQKRSQARATAAAALLPDTDSPAPQPTNGSDTIWDSIPADTEETQFDSSRGASTAAP